jgi:hypothetical protein
MDETDEEVTLLLHIREREEEVPTETTWLLHIDLSEDESHPPTSAHLSGPSVGLLGIESTERDYSGDVLPVDVHPGDSIEDIVERAWSQVYFVDWEP